MHTEINRDGIGRRLFASVRKALGLQFSNADEDARFFRKPEVSSVPLEPLPTDALVRPSMHNRVTTQIHHEDWP